MEDIQFETNCSIQVNTLYLSSKGQLFWGIKSDRETTQPTSYCTVYNVCCFGIHGRYILTPKSWFASLLQSGASVSELQSRQPAVVSPNEEFMSISIAWCVYSKPVKTLPALTVNNLFKSVEIERGKYPFQLTYPKLLAGLFACSK